MAQNMTASDYCIYSTFYYLPNVVPTIPHFIIFKLLTTLFLLFFYLHACFKMPAIKPKSPRKAVLGNIHHLPSQTRSGTCARIPLGLGKAQRSHRVKCPSS